MKSFFLLFIFIYLKKKLKIKIKIFLIYFIIYTNNYFAFKNYSFIIYLDLFIAQVITVYQVNQYL